MVSTGFGSGSDSPCHTIILPPRPLKAVRSGLSALWMNSSVIAELLVERKLNVSVESEGPEVIVGIFEDRILKERGVLWIWYVPDRLSLIEFARLRHPWIDLFARGQVHRRPSIHTLEGFDLGRGETCRVVGTGAEQTLGVEIATPRVIDLAVHKTVQLVAGRYHRLEDCRQLADRDGVRAGGILMIALPSPDVPRTQLQHPKHR